MSTRNAGNGRGAEPTANWRQTAFLPIAEAARILGVSRAQLYKHERMGRLALRRSLGRTVLQTEDVIRLVNEAERWTPEPRRNAAAVQAIRNRCARTSL
ncbi:hypothetical protein [Microvirga massiliensis]|uniref:hypothetical protein n=1 Tax=Microvirga massiliensis TaxID=1033741 RepID=UPI00062BCD3B|nr:hypothetical protein [Microvirga massiliensis]